METTITKWEKVTVLKRGHWVLMASGLKRCMINDPNLDECILQSAKFALPKIAKGLPAVGMKGMDPIKNERFFVQTANGPVWYKGQITNISIAGPSNVEIRKITYLKKNTTILMEGLHKHIVFQGNYKVEGAIFVFPVKSNGWFKFDIYNLLANHTLKLRKDVKSRGHGKVGFIVISTSHCTVELKDPNLGTRGSNALATLVNNNWEPVMEVSTPLMQSAMNQIYSKALQPLTSVFSLNDFFPNPNNETEITELDEIDEPVEKNEFVYPIDV